MNQEAALRFIDLLHGGLHPAGDGVVAYVLRRDGGRVENLTAHPAALPERILRPGPDWHVWRSVLTFRTGRDKSDALVVPALWCDIDPPKGPSPEALAEWRDGARDRLSGFSPAPTLVVDSGRGFHGYWLMRPVVRLEGPCRSELARKVVALNRSFKESLDGDAVGDLARVMRLPGTVNPKNGALCRLVGTDGPLHRFEDLSRLLEPPVPVRVRAEESPESARKYRGRVPAPTEHPIPRTRGRGRPRKAVTVRNLRELSTWAKGLVVGGVWRGGTRYSKPEGGGLDRSRADMAAVRAMVAARWDDARIVAAFERPDWKIGDRFRELWGTEERKRAIDYISRTILRARCSLRPDTTSARRSRE